MCGTIEDMETPATPSKALGSPKAAKTKTALILILFGLLAVLGTGLFFAFVGPSSPVGAGWFLFSYTMGLTMIVLPCTFPLAFVIVPLAMGKDPKKGFGMALAFGAGVAITLSLYGVLAALVGKVAITSLNAPLETVKNWLYAFAGIFAYLFALGELGFVRFRMPTYSGAAPMFIQKKKDILKALLLGLFMGNIGVGCPHPATPLILTRIAASGNVFYGWLLFFVHALGRITPLLILAILGILGVNALAWLTKRREKIERATGWAMVFVAGFIFTLGFFTHDWWVYSGQHTLLESVTQEERYLTLLGKKLGTGNPHHHGIPTGTGLFGLPLWLGNWTLIFLWIVPMLWYVVRRQDRIATLPQNEREKEEAVLPWLKAFIFTLILLLSVVVGWALPHRFLKHEALEDAHHSDATMRRSESRDLNLVFSSDPDVFKAGVPVTLSFTFPGARLDDFEIEHERFFHLVAIREDLTTFTHLHPEPSSESPARFELTHSFPLSGTYLLAVNYRYRGKEGTWQKLVRVSGNDPVIPDTDLSRTKSFGPYEVTLVLDPETPRAGEETHLRWTITKNGSPVRDLAPYLAAPVHIAVVRDDLSFFLHEHGEVPNDTAAFLPLVSMARAHGEENEGMGTDHGEHADLPNAFGPSVEAHLTFPRAGRYKIFGEFLHERRVLLTGFLIDVSERR
jgi:cytochrome c biogenesis protein CcdA